jgi:hypothetical protein
MRADGRAALFCSLDPAALIPSCDVPDITPSPSNGPAASLIPIEFEAIALAACREINAALHADASSFGSACSLASAAEQIACRAYERDG